MTRASASRHSSLSEMMRTDSEDSDYSESNVRSSKRRQASGGGNRSASQRRRGASGRRTQRKSSSTATTAGTAGNKKRKRTRRDRYEDEVGDGGDEEDYDYGIEDEEDFGDGGGDDEDVEYEEDYVSDHDVIRTRTQPLEDIAEVEGEGEEGNGSANHHQNLDPESVNEQAPEDNDEERPTTEITTAFDDNGNASIAGGTRRSSRRRTVNLHPPRRPPPQTNGTKNQLPPEAPPMRRSLRNLVKGRTTRYTEDDSEFDEEGGGGADGGAVGGRRLMTRGRGGGADGDADGDGKDDDFKPNPELEEEEEDVPISEPSEVDSPSKNSRNNKNTSRKRDVSDYSYGGAGDGGYNSPPRTRLRPRKRRSPDPLFTTERDELAQEVRDLRSRRKSETDDVPFEVKHPRRRTRKNVDYRVFKPEELLKFDEEEDEAILTTNNESPSKRRGAGANAYRKTLFPTYGPFGGAGGPTPLFGGPQNVETLGGIDSDSSDEEIAPEFTGDARKHNNNNNNTNNTFAGATAAAAAGAVSTDPLLSQNANNQGTLGKIKDRKALADLDPLGVDQNINFDSVGGLSSHILKLKEMVSLPLLYPEVFMQFKIVPPRGVLFHGPPGTGKTLLARALAADVSSGGRKVTFYMRKGADILSKWLGEAERQLRLLFEEARKSQPSIIFFDEIDGLAPVRSSKQEQIHSSIVSTLLALMDGMDGRGQVIVIGATNRPDAVDPALRRPGRFDREFYFQLPNTEARRAILDIHTKGWTPPLSDAVKNELAKRSKGYGGADLRALCTEAALNAVQRKYPQIYRSSEKLLIDPRTIHVTPQDFMLSLKTIVPSSERSASSGASPLPRMIEPLLAPYLKDIIARLREVLPPQRNASALEEAEYEDAVASASGFEREELLQAFDSSCCMRPRLLIHGRAGMGQQYLTAAVLNHLEGTYIQSFDLATLLGDSARSTEAAVIQLFTEAKRHKPSIIYLPDISRWQDTIPPTTLSTFYSLVNSLLPSDPVLILGVLEYPKTLEEDSITQCLFPHHDDDRFCLQPPKDSWRHDFFRTVMELIKKPAIEFPPDAEHRKKRVLESLPPAPPEDGSTKNAAVEPSREEIKAQRKKDRQTLNLLKIRLQPMMDHIKVKYKRFRTGVIDDSRIAYLFDDNNPGVVTSDVPAMEQQAEGGAGDQASYQAQRPFEKSVDKHGVPGLRETATNKFYYNLDVVTIERRLANGYYKRPKDFYTDIKRVAKDSREFHDQERQLKASELLSNVSVEIATIEAMDPAFVAECEGVWARDIERNRIAVEKARADAESQAQAQRVEEEKEMPHGQEQDREQPQTEAQHHDSPMGPPNAPHASSSTPTRPQEQVAGPSDAPVESHSVGESASSQKHQQQQQADKNTTTPQSSDKKDTSQNGPNGSHESLQRLDTVPNHDTPPNGGGAAGADGDIVMTNSEETPTKGSGGIAGKNSGSGSGNGGAGSGSGVGAGADARSSAAQSRPDNMYSASSRQTQFQMGVADLPQKESVTPMVHGSQPDDYANDASTTQSNRNDSGQKHTNSNQSNYHAELSHRESNSFGGGNTAGYKHPGNATGGGSGGAGPGGGTDDEPYPQQPAPDLPPTQSHTSYSSQHSALLPPHAEVSNYDISELHHSVAYKTRDLSVAHLEWINSKLMKCVWRLRRESNRGAVAEAAGHVFMRALEDVRTQESASFSS